MIRKRFEWQVQREALHVGERTFIAAFLDLASDNDPDRAFVRASTFAAEGADYVEIGLEPAAGVAEAEELRRLVPVLKRLKSAPEIRLAVMTSKSAVAAKAIEHGASIVHDPTGLTADADLAKVVAQGDAGLILSHMRGSPETWPRLGSYPDPAGALIVEMDAAIGRAVRSGVLRKRIVIDPGFDYGKRKEQNIDLLEGLDRLATFDLPLHIAPSGRRWVAQALACDATDLAALTAGILRGAHIVRVHQVTPARAAAALADALLLAQPAEPALPKAHRRWHRGQ